LGESASHFDLTKLKKLVSTIKRREYLIYGEKKEEEEIMFV
jgi:hypothetical protein